MACANALRLCIAAALVVASAAQDESSIMRRQKSNSRVHLGAGGEMHLHEDVHRVQVQEHKPKKTNQPAQAWFRMTQNGQIKTKAKQPGELSYCDTSYPLGTPNSNSCIKGTAINREEDCRHAAGVLNVTKGAPNFIIKDDWVNPNVYSKGCFKFNNTVFFNPTDSDRKDGWQGTPICTYAIYQNGTTEKDSSEGCTGDYEPITDYKECEWAHDCQWGGMYCQDPNFGNDKYETLEAPRGCYRNKLGCYGFNAGKAAPTKFTETTPVCRLKTYKFTGPKEQ